MYAAAQSMSIPRDITPLDGGATNVSAPGRMWFPCIASPTEELEVVVEKRHSGISSTNAASPQDEFSPVLKGPPAAHLTSPTAHPTSPTAHLTSPALRVPVAPSPKMSFFQSPDARRNKDPDSTGRIDSRRRDKLLEERLQRIEALLAARMEKDRIIDEYVLAAIKRDAATVRIQALSKEIAAIRTRSEAVHLLTSFLEHSSSRSEWEAAVEMAMSLGEKRMFEEPSTI